jgi:hypothetical protein
MLWDSLHVLMYLLTFSVYEKNTGIFLYFLNNHLKDNNLIGFDGCEIELLKSCIARCDISEPVVGLRGI